MKNKIVMITAALAVMIAMTGIAGASIVIATPDPLNDVDTSTFKTQSVSVTTTQNEIIDDFAISAMTKGLSGLSVIPTNIFYIEIDSLSVGVITDTTNYASPHTYDVKYKLKNAADAGTYIVTYSSTGVSSSAYVTTATVNAIPEFATVAIPIAAVLGLVFFFQQRKNKKE